MKTRDRIVLQARNLFNDQGYGAVTTAMLAAHLGIAEGNLWYHFKTRQALLEAIAEQFAERIEARLELAPDPADPIGSYARMLGRLMAELNDFRFIYRDQASYGEHVEPVSGKAPDWLMRTFDQFEGYFATLAEAGLLDWPRERLRDLAINTTIILRHGLEHYRELGEATEAGSGAVRRTLHRHLTLFEHRLDPGAAARLHQAIEAIGTPALAA